MNVPTRVGVVLAGFVATFVQAQPSNGAGNPTAAEKAWETLSQLAIPDAMRAVPTNSGDKLKSQLQLEIDRLLFAADTAKNLHSNFPNDGKAAVARKIEILSRLAAVGLGASDPAGSVWVAADVFRRDQRNPVGDRYEVALAAECMATPASRTNITPGNTTAEERLADTLFAEFGDIPQVQAHYASLMRTSDATVTARIAGKLNQRQLPAELKQEVQRALALGVKLGKPVELSLSTLDGQKVDFSRNSAVTVVCFWNVWAGPAELAPLTRNRPLAGNGVTWVFIGLGGTPPDLAVMNAAAPFAGQHCHDPAGLAGSAMATLGVQQAPAVAVLGPRGKLIGSGSFERLPALLAEAAR